ncbi:discoidin domain-containing protein [Paenibacillus endophyticus]|uniref:discoidin domain-containing protein n=1 Tax=Paenibacillus endophyticus TaxID=1294268 RepID=UPI0035E45333
MQYRTRGWSSSLGVTSNHTESVTIDLGSANIVSKVDLYPRNDSGQWGSFFPINFTIQVSTSGTTWSTVATQTNYPKPTSGGVQSFNISPVNARYVKVEGTNLRLETGTEYMMQFAELEIYKLTKAIIPSGIIAFVRIED